MSTPILKAIATSALIFGLSSCGEGGKSPNPGTNDSTSTKLRCNELMYNAGLTDSLEWIEIELSRGSNLASMSTSMLRLEGAIDYLFPNEPLAVKERIVVASDTSLFRARYPQSQYPVRLFGPFVGRLNNAGEVVEVKILGAGDASCHYSPAPPWPSLAAGRGHSLIYVDGSASRPESYGASLRAGGNPGGADTTIPAITVLVNEVQPGSSANPGWVELYNPTSQAVDLSGWLLSDNLTSGDTLPPNTVIDAGAYLLIPEAEWDLSFYPAQNGDNVYLMQLVDGQWTGATTGLSYPALLPAQSAGIVELADGDLARGPMSPTPGAVNGSLFVGPVRISEIHYNPPEGSAEFLELANSTDSSINLFSPLPWTVEGIAFSFPAGSSIPAHGKIVLLRAEDSSVEAFRAAYGLDTSIHIYPYTGKLSNRGELITVRMPILLASGAMSYGWSDGALYGDEGVWPDSADGLGQSLERVHLEYTGEDPAAWVGATPNPGQ